MRFSPQIRIRFIPFRLTYENKVIIYYSCYVFQLEKLFLKTNMNNGIHIKHKRPYNMRGRTHGFASKEFIERITPKQFVAPCRYPYSFGFNFKSYQAQTINSSLVVLEFLCLFFTFLSLVVIFLMPLVYQFYFNL